MLTSKQRAEFRAQANALETTLMVGKDGVTEAVIEEADRLLTARELNKDAVVLVISTEGDTDVKHYREVVWEGKHAVAP